VQALYDPAAKTKVIADSSAYGLAPTTAEEPMAPNCFWLY